MSARKVPVPAEVEARCIGCGCTDSHGCDRGCFWLRINRQNGRGICSSCDHLVAKWDRNQRRGLVYGQGT